MEYADKFLLDWMDKKLGITREEVARMIEATECETCLDTKVYQMTGEEPCPDC